MRPGRPVVSGDPRAAPSPSPRGRRPRRRPGSPTRSSGLRRRRQQPSAVVKPRCSRGVINPATSSHSVRLGLPDRRGLDQIRWSPPRRRRRGCADRRHPALPLSVREAVPSLPTPSTPDKAKTRSDGLVSPGPRNPPATITVPIDDGAHCMVERNWERRALLPAVLAGQIDLHQRHRRPALDETAHQEDAVVESGAGDLGARGRSFGQRPPFQCDAGRGG